MKRSPVSEYSVGNSERPRERSERCRSAPDPHRPRWRLFLAFHGLPWCNNSFSSEGLLHPRQYSTALLDVWIPMPRRCATSPFPCAAAMEFVQWDAGRSEFRRRLCISHRKRVYFRHRPSAGSGRCSGPAKAEELLPRTRLRQVKGNKKPARAGGMRRHCTTAYRALRLWGNSSAAIAFSKPRTVSSAHCLFRKIIHFAETDNKKKNALSQSVL